MKSLTRWALRLFAGIIITGPLASAAEIKWTSLSIKKGDLPVPEEGEVDWPAVLKAAQEAELKHYFIEAIDQIPGSLRYLDQIKF